jgi:trans-aconitate methyltransferase
MKKSKSYLLENPDTFKVESERLEIQARQLLSLELPSLRLHGFSEGLNILDVGCGNGSYLKVLQEQHSKLKLSGVDRNSGLIDQAKVKCPTSTFFVEDLTNIKGFENILKIVQPQLLISRFVFQHMHTEEQETLLRSIKLMKPKKAKVLIVDVDDSLVKFNPPSQSISKLLESKIQKQRENGGDRMVGSKLPELLKRCGFSNILSTQVELNNKNLTWNALEAIAWPYIKEGASNPRTEEEAYLIGQGDKWWKTAATEDSYVAKFIQCHVSGI